MTYLKRRKRVRAGIREETRVRCPGHLQFVRGFLCAVQDSYCAGRIEAAHIRMGTDGGLGIKPSDCYVVPLCTHHHRKQHAIGEHNFWIIRRPADPVKIATDLWKQSPARHRYEQRQRERAEA